jgi:hypothetical protein
MRRLLGVLGAALLAGCGDGAEGARSQAQALGPDGGPFDETHLSSWEIQISPADWDAIAAQIREAVREDPVKPFALGDFDWAAGNLKAYFEARAAAFQTQLGGP